MNSDAARLDELPTYFGNVLSAIIPLIGMVAFIMILIGGFKILTSGGDPKGLQGGKQTISWAVGGLVLAIVAWLILVLIEDLTGSPVTQFNFGF